MRKDFRKANLVIFIFLVLLPAVVALSNSFLAESHPLSWFYDNVNTISFIALLTSIVFCALIIILNAKSNQSVGVWYILPVITGLLLLILLYIGYSLSHFGF